MKFDTWAAYNDSSVELIIDGKKRVGKINIYSCSDLDCLRITVKVDKIYEYEHLLYSEGKVNYATLNIKLRHRNNEELKLYNCRRFGNSIYPEYVIMKDSKSNNDKFNTIFVYLNGLSNAFVTPIGWHKLSLTFNKDQDKFNVFLKQSGIKITGYWEIDSEEDCNLNNQLNVNISMKYVLKVQFNEKHLLSYINESVKKIMALFSLLTLKPLTINAISLGSIKKDYLQRNPLFIEGILSTEKKAKIRFYADSLIIIRLLKNDQWEKIFNNLHDSSDFWNFCKRFRVALSYRGIWVNQFLDFFSLFETFLKTKYSGNGRNENHTVVAKIKSIIKKNISDLTLIQQSVYKKSDLTLHNQLNNLYDNFFKDFSNIIEILNFDKKLFKRIIKIRNAVAHNDVEKLNEIEEGYNENNILLNKLKVLLASIGYLQLGFSAKTLASHFSRSTITELVNSDKNDFFIDNLVGCFTIRVNLDDFNYINTSKILYLIVELTVNLESGKNKHELNKNKSSKLDHAIKNNTIQKYNNCKDLVETYYPKTNKIEYYHGWIRCGNKKIKKRIYLVK